MSWQLIKGKIKNPCIFNGFYELYIQIVRTLANKGKMTICTKTDRHSPIYMRVTNHRITYPQFVFLIP